MYLDAKQVVLLGIYTECQKDLPNMDNIRHDKLGLEPDAFKLAIARLQNEGLIKGVYIVYGRKRYVPLSVWVSRVIITTYGIDILKQNLKFNDVTGQEKVKNVIGNSAKWVRNN